MPDETIERIFSENPLSAFSIYTHIQVQILRHLGNEIIALLDNGINSNQVDGEMFNSVYGKFWLWVLGTFEVTRTMVQAKSCFEDRLFNTLKSFKGKVSQLRVPFAKQEYPGAKTPIRNEASIFGVDSLRKDLSFRVKDQTFSIRDMLAEFDGIISSLQIEDIRYDHRESYQDKKVN